MAPYDNGQGWPDVQHLLNWCSGFTVESQIQAMRRPKNYVSPVSAHVYQRVPRLYPCLIHIETKYFQEGNVWEHADCHLGYIEELVQAIIVKKKVRTLASFGRSLSICLHFGQRMFEMANYHTGDPG
jgi:hypothetical protein